MLDEYLVDFPISGFPLVAELAYLSIGRKKIHGSQKFVHGERAAVLIAAADQRLQIFAVQHRSAKNVREAAEIVGRKDLLAARELLEDQPQAHEVMRPREALNDEGKEAAELQEGNMSAGRHRLFPESSRVMRLSTTLDLQCIHQVRDELEGA